MEYSIEWRETPWLLTLVMRGQATPETYAAMTRDQMRYLDGANGRLYWISDLRQMGAELGQPMDPAVMPLMMKSPTVTHPNAGQYAMVCSTAFMRFITTMIVQSPANQTPLGVPIRMFDTPEEAEAFCRDVAEVDTRRATACTPIPLVD